MATLLQDLKYALRHLTRSPTFSVISILTLALGIGATTAMFTIVRNVLLRPLNYPSAQQLVVLREHITTPQTEFSDLAANANHLLFWRDHSQSFTTIAALLPISMPIGTEQPEEIGVARSTANLPSVFGYRPRLGRAFTPEEEKPGHDVVLLTDGLWHRRYSANPSIIGATIPLDGRQYLVVGVLPPDFVLPNSRSIGGYTGVNKPIEAFIPFAWSAENLAEIEGDHNYFAVGRLKPGVSLAQAEAEINALQRSISQQTPDKLPLSARLIPLQQYLVGSSRNTLLLLLAAVSGILLIACTNLTNLLLTRAAGRGHESALRLALGATRARLLRISLMEPLLLSAFGCVSGILFAEITLHLLLHRLPTDIPRLAEIHIDLTVVAFATGISLLAAAACGLFPSWRILLSAPQLALRSETRTSSESKAAKRLRQALVIGEVTASVMLVLLAGLFLTSLLKLLQVDRGFQAQHILSAELNLPAKQFSEDTPRNAFYEQALERLRQLPGVESVGAISVLPLDGDNWGDFISKVGDTHPIWQKNPGHFRWITPGFFETMRVPLLAGRLLSPADRGRSVAIISRQVANTVWPGQDPIGQKFVRGDPDEPPFEVIGVVGDIRSLDLGQAAPNMVYMPYWYRSRTSASFVLRTTGDPDATASALRKALWQIEPTVAIPQIRTMQEIVDGSVSVRRLQMHLLLAFAASSVLLAALGIYGVVAYTTAQRTQEIGIRLALGATRANVCRLVLAEGVLPVLIGTLLGVTLAWLSGRYLAGLLFGVHPQNPLLAAISCAILIAIGILASLLPAWRATSIDPNTALRYE